MDRTILVPDIGDYSSVEVIEVVVKEGDHLKKDDTLITLETDKATMDIPAPFNLEITKILVKSGDRVSKGSLIANVVTLDILDATELGRLQTRDQQGQSIALVSKSAVEQTSPALATATISQSALATATISQPVIGLRGLSNANPKVRKFARELGVNLDNIIGTAKHGRIVEQDIKSYVNQLLNNANHNINNSNNHANLSSSINMDFSKWGPIREQPLSRIKKKSGQNLHRNWVSIPHVTHFDSADITDLEKFRKQQQQSPKASSLKLTFLGFLIKVIVKALQKYPNFNSALTIDGENLILKNYYNIGIAVDTEGGLVVPVVKNADQKNIFVLAEELALLSQKARDNKLIAEDLQGGCFTISSLGGIGGNNFTPIINAPEVAILGVSRNKITPTYVNQELQARLILPLALSYDHRVIDGAEAAKFCKYIVEQLEDVKNFYV